MIWRNSRRMRSRLSKQYLRDPNWKGRGIVKRERKITAVGPIDPMVRSGVVHGSKDDIIGNDREEYTHDPGISPRWEVRSRIGWTRPSVVPAEYPSELFLVVQSVFPIRERIDRHRPCPRTEGWQ